MSAYVVDPAHVDVILSTAIHGPRGRAVFPGSWTPPYTNELLPDTSGPFRREDADRAGEVLLAECIASVSFRYREPDAGLPGPIPTPDPRHFVWRDFGRLLTAVEACKAIDCFEYQSSEHPAWVNSGAREFCHRLRRELIRAMPGYEDAPSHWSIEMAIERGSFQTIRLGR